MPVQCNNQGMKTLFGSEMKTEVETFISSYEVFCILTKFIMVLSTSVYDKILIWCFLFEL